MDDVKISVKNEKEPETLTQTIGIYSQDIGMKHCIRKKSYTYIKSDEKEKNGWNRIDESSRILET